MFDSNNIIVKCALRSVCRLSVRAFTQLYDEDVNDITDRSPLFTDTFLSLPVVTEAGERFRLWLHLNQFMCSEEDEDGSSLSDLSDG